jgi:hypothetical protein
MRHTVMGLGNDLQECSLQEVVVADWEYYIVIQVYWTDGRAVISLVILVTIPAGVRTGHLYSEKGLVIPVTVREVTECRWRYSCTFFLTSALDGVGSQR